MRKIIPVLLAIALMSSCSDDDNETTDDTNDPVTEIENLVYNESEDGNLSDDGSAPTTITFETGDNIIIAEQTPDSPDYFTFSVPDGYELSELIVEDFSIADPAFIGIADGTTVNGAEAADFLGGLVYGTGNIDTNILTEIGILEGAAGFTDTLPAGDYAVWLNQTGEASTATLNFVITLAPEEENILFDESTDGELSDNGSTPTALTFEFGDNVVIAEQASDSPDYFTFSVPDGYELSELIVEGFSIADPGFIGIAEGTIIDGGEAGDLLGGLVYGTGDLDTNILPEIGTLDGATGFIDTLPAGEYTVWLNQTGQTSTARLNFVISLL